MPLDHHFAHRTGREMKLKMQNILEHVRIKFVVEEGCQSSCNEMLLAMEISTFEVNGDSLAVELVCPLNLVLAHKGFDFNS